MEDDEGLFVWLLNALYVFSTTMCLACSLWVIYTAMNLINLSIHSTLYGETMREIAEADQLIEMRMKELRLVFVTSLVALVLAGLSMITCEAEWPFAVTACFVFVFAGWHAAKSDEGTVILYQRYTGLEVKDRWHGERWREQIRDLLLPFGQGNHSSALRYQTVRDKAETSIAAFLAAGRTHKKHLPSGEVSTDSDRFGPEALRAALKSTHLKKARAFSRRKPSSMRRRSSLGSTITAMAESPAATPTSMDGGAALGKELLDISASMIQSVWRAGQVNITRHEWHGGWLWKTASGGGPVENLRGAWSSLDANAVSAIPNVAELAPTVPRHRRWFVLAPKKGTLTIYTSDQDHKSGQAAKGQVSRLSAYTIMRLASPSDGRAVLALMPRAAIDSRGPPPPSPPSRSASMSGALAPASAAPVDSDGKSWYLRAEDDAKTAEWFHRLEEAGVHATDTLHTARHAVQTPSYLDNLLRPRSVPVAAPATLPPGKPLPPAGMEFSA